jgi:hypothetical protein
VADPSPFHVLRLADPSYLADSENVSIDLQPCVRFLDYVWLYLQAHGYDFVILHRSPAMVPEIPVRLERVERLMAPAAVHADELQAAYDTRKLAQPTMPALVCTEGWGERRMFHERLACLVGRQGSMAVYRPASAGRLRFTFEAMSLRAPRTVRLMAGERELGRWRVSPGPHRFARYESPPFELPEGVSTLTLLSDGEPGPIRRGAADAASDWSRFSLRVAAVRLEPAAAGASESVHLDPPGASP